LLLGRIIRQQNQLATTTALVLGIAEASLVVPNYGRVPWGERFLQVDVPRLQRANRTTVVMTSNDAMAFIIPSFPATVRFVRIECNFYQPDATTRLLARAHELLSLPDQDYFLLTVADQVQNAISAVAHFEFRIDKGSCMAIRTSLDGPQNSTSPLTFCRLERNLADTAGTNPAVSGGSPAQ
jgi:hypothetical protein